MLLEPQNVFYLIIIVFFAITYFTVISRHETAIHNNTEDIKIKADTSRVMRLENRLKTTEEKCAALGERISKLEQKGRTDTLYFIRLKK